MEKSCLLCLFSFLYSVRTWSCVIGSLHKPLAQINKTLSKETIKGCNWMFRCMQIQNMWYSVTMNWITINNAVLSVIQYVMVILPFVNIIKITHFDKWHPIVCGLPPCCCVAPIAFSLEKWLTLVGSTDPFLWIGIQVRQAAHAKVCNSTPMPQHHHPREEIWSEGGKVEERRTKQAQSDKTHVTAIWARPSECTEGEN